jgi:hypothetical protein
VSLLSCAREVAQPTFNPSGLREAFEDPMGVMKTRATVVVVVRARTQITQLQSERSARSF